MILDLTIARVRQITAAIVERKTIEDRKNRSLLAWQTKLICGYIAAANPPVEGENILLEQAQEITLDPKKLNSISEENSDDNSTERPIRYADTNALALFARGLSAGGPVPAN